MERAKGANSLVMLRQGPDTACGLAMEGLQAIERTQEKVPMASLQALAAQKQREE